MDYVFAPFLNLLPELKEKARAISDNVVTHVHEGRGLQPFKAGKDRLFVIGHCHAGSDHLSSTRTGGMPVSVTTVADRLIGNGLQMQPGIEIILLACEAGRPDSHDSFANQLTKAMSDRQFPVKVRAAKNSVLVNGCVPGWAYEELGPGKRDGIREFSRPAGSGKRPAL